MLRENTYAFHYHKSLKLSLPIVFSNLGHMMTALADSVMVGQLGSTPLAAVSLGSNVFAIFLVAGIGLSLGVTPQTATAHSKKDFPAISKLFFNATCLYALFAIFLCILFQITLTPLVGWMDQPNDVVDLTIPYMRLLLLSLIPLMLFQAGKQLAEGLSLTQSAMFISIGCNLLNVALNYGFIFGKMGFPELGLMGAGWATLIARIVMAITMMGYLFLPHIKKHFNLKWNWGLKSWATIRELSTLGLPMSIQMILEVSAFSGAAIMVGWIGAEALAAHQIALTLASITYMAANGFAAAATVRVSNQRGLGNIFQLRRAAFSVYHIIAGFMGACALLLILTRQWLPTLFINEKAVIEATSSLLLIAAIFQLSDGLQVAGLSALRGLEDVNIPTGISLLAYWVIGLPTGYWLGIAGNWGVQGIWIGLLIGLSTAAFLLTWRFNIKTQRE